jgi:hypothetical protein
VGAGGVDTGAPVGKHGSKDTVLTGEVSAETENETPGLGFLARGRNPGTR